jgi:hypothetical protein
VKAESHQLTLEAKGSSCCLRGSPENGEAHPGVMETRPGDLDSHSEVVEVHLGFVKAHKICVSEYCNINTVGCVPT